MKFEQLILGIACIVYGITAFYSEGYLHPDEHCQIIEFAGLLSGANRPDDLVWEYHKQIRSSIQPVLCHTILKACSYFSIISSYSQAFILRLLTASFAIISINFFTISCRRLIPNKYWSLFLILSYFIWFIPLISVRFSSETFSGLFLLAIVGIILRENKEYKTYILIGVLSGLSFLFRFQIALSIIGLLAWLLIIRREELKKVVIVCLFGGIVLFVGIMLDSWFYGKFTIAFYKYFKVNLVDRVAAEYGILPWYYYITCIYMSALKPIAIIIFISYILLIVKNYKNLILWITLPFLIGHSIISHKELRFLFPIVYFIPFIIIYGIEFISGLKKFNRPLLMASKIVLIFIFIANFFNLCIICTKPAGDGLIHIARKIHEINNLKNLHVYYVADLNPFSPWGLPTNFYKEKNAITTNLDQLSSDIKIHQSNTRNVLVCKMQDLNDENVQSIIKEFNMSERCANLPDFIFNIVKYDNTKAGILYVLFSD